MYAQGLVREHWAHEAPEPQLQKEETTVHAARVREEREVRGVCAVEGVFGARSGKTIAQGRCVFTSETFRNPISVGWTGHSKPEAAAWAVVLLDVAMEGALLSWILPLQ